MPIQDYSNASALLRNTAPRAVVDPSSRPIDLIQFLQSRGRFMSVDALGGAEPFVWSLVKDNGSTAGRFVEGQALPAGARRSFSNPSVSAYYWREAVRVTGRARDVARHRGYVEDDLLAREQENATMNVLYAMEGDLLGSTVNIGLPSIIDNTDFYGGVDPAVVTVHASKVSAVAGAQTAATMADHYEAQMSPPYNSYATDILAPPNQATNYIAIVGLNGSSNRPVMPLPQPGQRLDVGINPAKLDFNGIPWSIIRNATATELLWVNAMDLYIALQRDLGYKPLAELSDDVVGQVSVGAMIVAMNRRLHSKQEGVTA